MAGLSNENPVGSRAVAPGAGGSRCRAGAVRLARVLHTSALATYANGSFFMGTVVALTATQGAQLIIPATCLISAWAGRPRDSGLIEYLTRLARQDGSSVTEVVPLRADAWLDVAYLMSATSGMDLASAHTAVVAADRHVPVIADATTAAVLAVVAPAVTVEALP